MFVQYDKKKKKDFTKKGWDEQYKSDSVNIKERVKLLVNDKSIDIFLSEIYKSIFSLREEGKPVNVLDVGCGLGHQLCSFSFLCDSAIGLDFSDAVVDSNNRLNNSAEFIQGDAFDLSSLKKDFSIITMAGVLYNTPEEKNHKKIISEIYNLLSNNGLFIFYHRHNLNMVRHLRLLMNKYNLRSIDKEDLAYARTWFDDKYLTKLLRNQGFFIETIRKSDFVNPLTCHRFYRLFTKKGCFRTNDFKDLNILGKLTYMVSKYLFNSISARSSFFVCRKTTN